MTKIIPIKVSKQFLAPARFERVMRNFLKGGAENVRIDFGVATQTWQHKPKFQIKVTAPYEREIFTVSLVRGKPIFKFVSGGTRVRYAHMSRDWQSKTQPNVLGSGPGQGRMLYVNKNKPLPGIVARNFAHLIVEKWDPLLPALYARLIHDELSR